MTPPHLTTLNCPVCEHSHTSPLVATFDVSGEDSDFCPKFEGDNPLPTLLHVCPLCGYCGFAPDFSAIEDAKQLETLRGAVRALDWTPGQVLSGAERYRRAALFAAWLGKRNAEIAELWLQATWCVRLEGGSEGHERRSRQKAIKYFEIALAEGEFSPSDTAAVHYLLGELNRRAGRSDAAIEEFRQVTTESGADHELLILRDQQLGEIIPEIEGPDPSNRHRLVDGGRPPSAA